MERSSKNRLFVPGTYDVKACQDNGFDCAYNYAILPTPQFEGNSITPLLEDLSQLAIPCRHPYNPLQEIVTASWGDTNT
jgi:hypothetical protein